MKKNLYFVCMMVALMAASVNLASCSKSDDGGSGNGGGASSSIPSDYAGIWKCDEYCPADKTTEIWSMYEEDGWPPTTVTIKGDGSCSGSGMVINGNGTCTIKKGSKMDDGYYAMITFYQDGKVVSTAKVRSYLNDHRTGYVELQGYSDKWFIFKK